MFYKIFYFHFDFPACRKAQTDSTDGTKNREDGLEGGVYIWEQDKGAEVMCLACWICVIPFPSLMAHQGSEVISQAWAACNDDRE